MSVKYRSPIGVAHGLGDYKLIGGFINLKNLALLPFHSEEHTDGKDYGCRCTSRRTVSLLNPTSGDKEMGRQGRHNVAMLRTEVESSYKAHPRGNRSTDD